MARLRAKRAHALHAPDAEAAISADAVHDDIAWHRDVPAGRVSAPTVSGYGSSDASVSCDTVTGFGTRPSEAMKSSDFCQPAVSITP